MTRWLRKFRETFLRWIGFRAGADASRQEIRDAVESVLTGNGLPAAPVAPDWLPEHQVAWVNFLRTNAGATLMARCRAVSGEVARRACTDLFHTQHSAGVAAGWEECRTWLESLSRASRAQDDATDIPTGQGEPSLDELLAP